MLNYSGFKTWILMSITIKYTVLILPFLMYFHSKALWHQFCSILILISWLLYLGCFLLFSGLLTGLFKLIMLLIISFISGIRSSKGQPSSGCQVADVAWSYLYQIVPLLCFCCSCKICASLFCSPYYFVNFVKLFPIIFCLRQVIEALHAHQVFSLWVCDNLSTLQVHQTGLGV